MGFPLVMDEEISGSYFIYSDITETKKQENKIHRLTYNDSLTGLFNRNFFFQNLENEILKKIDNQKNKEQLVVLILKVKEFKEINEALGHLVGDLMLKEFALRLRDSIQSQNTIARFSEDEFAIMMPKIEAFKEIDILINAIIKNCKSSFFIDDNELYITTNIGIAIYPDDGLEGDALIRKAEIAMDKGKKISVNSSIQFDSSYEKEIQENFWIKKDLLTALENDELFLHYQPIYDISTNELIAVEALIRWNHKEKGIIQPLKFIEIAEQTGLIHPIGEWVLREACNQNRKWQEQGYKPICVSVNISVLQLENSGFSNIVKRILIDSMLEPHYLQLEITETFFTQDYELIKGTIKEVSQLGVKFAIDDFGTGYSSLGQLSELRINNLKVDRMLISGVDDNISKSKIVKAIISLADSLDISLIAEGVEREEELSFLKESMCTMVQGYLFSKPVGRCKIEELLETT